MRERKRMSESQDWNAGYHDLYETGTEKFKKLYEKFYKAVYEKALALICQRIKNPLLKEKPNVLLCGTASSETTKNFIKFTQGKNSEANIEIVDLNNQPLEASKNKAREDTTIDDSHVNFIQGNALEMPFADESIDLLETDYFLQFFSPDDKQHLINEWARIISEEGAIMTREFLPDNKIYQLINSIRRKLAKKVGISTYETSVDELKKMFEVAGLQVDVIPMEFGPLKSGILKHLVAYKKTPAKK